MIKNGKMSFVYYIKECFHSSGNFARAVFCEKHQIYLQKVAVYLPFLLDNWARKW